MRWSWNFETKILSAEDRAKIAEQLQKLKADLSQQEAETEIDAINKVTKADRKHRKNVRGI